ncbi:MAG: hypothetical protein J2P47_14470, partial [Acetobacteraceae bacterium]|nr:hypothetical protein [Acetobacteraceae bacterium]
HLADVSPEAGVERQRGGLCATDHGGVFPSEGASRRASFGSGDDPKIKTADLAASKLYIRILKSNLAASFQGGAWR